MPKSYLRQSPLAHLNLETRNMTSGALPAAGVIISEHPHRTQIVVRGQSADPAFLTAIEKVLAIPLPTEACRANTSKEGTHILWMGPDEWLVVADAGRAIELSSDLTRAMSGLHVATTDVSESRTVIRISGPQAIQVLNKGCSIDLHPRSFASGHVVNTRLAQAHVILHQIDLDDETRSTTFEIYVHRSYAEYLWSWIEDSSREYGLKIE